MTVAVAPLLLGTEGRVEVEFASVAEADVLIAYPGSLHDWLADDEERLLRGLATPKRKRDWLAARLAAKRLVGRRLEALGRPAVHREIRILATPDREPFVALPGERDGLYPISLSHAGDWGACALAPSGCKIGFDLERIEPRDPAWPNVMADESELDAELKASAERLTRLWTAKEAVLKLLGLGLSVDMRSVRPRADGTVELLGKALEKWKELGLSSIQIYSARYHDCFMTAALAYER